MGAASIQVSETPLVLYVLRRADDALILGHRLSEWCGHAPMMEEDMAMANMGLDLLGQARELYSYAAKVEGKDNDEDKLAYLRYVRQYRNLLLLEQPNGDFARTMTRQFFYAAFSDLYWRAMMDSRDATLAAIAAWVSTCWGRPASSTAMPPRSKARTTTKTSSPICATCGSTATCCCSSSPMAILPAPCRPRRPG